MGELYNPQRKTWPEGGFLRLRGDAELVLALNNPTQREITAIRKGTPSWAWVDAADTGVLCFAFQGGVPWMDAPYTPHRDAPLDRPLFSIAQGSAGVFVVLVDARTGIIKAMRQTPWPAPFAAAVHATTARIVAAPFSASAADRATSALFARYPDTQSLVERRADIISQAGTIRGPQPDAAPRQAAPVSAPAAQMRASALGVPGRTYPGELPAELAPWYAYVRDGGHSIVVIPESLYGTGPADDMLTPVPVRTVLRLGWQTRDGYLVVPIAYDADLGVVVPEDDEEF
ncbi:hypothetical protein [Polymorphospora sp. NPDC050346]|uniref:hypothetical protein n=1 Tax=Polymorphospora sp. NPDC050346 TaxID=3155780 RepID=UPI0033E2DFCE